MKLWYGKLLLRIRSAKQEQKLRGEKKSKRNHPQKLAPTLALKWYPQDLVGRAKLFDIFAANQNQGGKRIFSPGISRLARKKARFTEGSLSFGRAY